jgi:DNA polymerase-3 subunit gamma/tau
MHTRRAGSVCPVTVHVMTNPPAPALTDTVDPASRRGLALRYRPRTFTEVTGQAHAFAILGRLIAAGHAPHQLLLSGDSGLGKTTVGRIYAAALLCVTPMGERNTGDACGTCPECVDATALRPCHPDVIELDAASNGGKDEIKELAQRAALAPMRGSRKVYIIDEVHAISGPGSQAFLKILEEPPAHVVFVLCTTNPEKLSSASGGAGTVRGRCLELELLRPRDTEIVANLQRIAAGEGATLPDEIAAMLLTATDETLGVRGTVMSLEKILPSLMGGTFDHDGAAALLGVAPRVAVRDLLDAMEARDRVGSMAALDDLRAATSDSAVRRALLDAVRADLHAALRAAAGIDAAAARLERTLATPAGRLWTDVLVMQLARPDLDALQVAAVAHDRAQLGAATKVAPAPAPALAPAPAPAPAPASTPVLDEVALTDQRAPDPAPAPAPDHASELDPASEPTSVPGGVAAPATPRDAWLTGMALAPTSVTAGPFTTAAPVPAATVPAAPVPHAAADHAIDESRLAPAWLDEPQDEDQSYSYGEVNEPPPAPASKPTSRTPSPARGRSGSPANGKPTSRPAPAKTTSPRPLPVAGGQSAVARSPKLEAILGMLAAAEPAAAVALARADVTFPSGKVRIVAAPADHALLSRAPVQQRLWAIARKVGCARVSLERGPA